MNEKDLVRIFYEESKARGVSHDQVFLNVDGNMVLVAENHFGFKGVDLKTLHELADICIANNWLERTTADPNYHFLSMTDDGLQAILDDDY